MGRGRKSQLPRDQQDYLESHYAEFIQIKPHLDNFWGRVERGWTSKWPVEVRLGLPLLNPDGVAIEESGRSQAEKLAIATAEEKERKSIHNWFYNRQSKEKRDINSSNLPSSSNAREIWQKRNGGVISAALKEAGFDELMGSTYAGESETARKERVSKGAKRTAITSNASEEETAAVEEEYKKQEKSLKSVSVSQQTPEEYQRRTAVDKYVERTAGLVGSTVLVGPIPNLGGKIGTQTYCHGVTPAGHTLDQAHSGWTDQVIKPLHQFGKKIFGLTCVDALDHDPRRKRALGAQDQSDLDITPSANAGDGSAFSVEHVTTPLAAPTSSTPEVPSDTPPTALPSVQTAPGAPNSSDAAPQASSDSSGATTTLFWPVDEDLGLDNPIPALRSRFISSSHPPPPHAGVSPGDPILPSSMLDDSPPAERPTEPVSSSTTIASVSPATVQPKALQHLPRALSHVPRCFHPHGKRGENGFSLRRHRPRPYWGRAPRRPLPATLPPRQCPLRLLFVVWRASFGAVDDTTRHGVPMRRRQPLHPTSTISLPVGRTVPSSTPSAAHAPSSTPPTSTPTASPVVPITTRRRRVRWRCQDAVGGAGEEAAGDVEEGAGEDVEEVEQEVVELGVELSTLGYLLRVDPEKGNVWQIGTVSRQRREGNSGQQRRLVMQLPPPLLVIAITVSLSSPHLRPGHAALPAGPAALGARMPPPEPRVLGLRGPRERTNTAKYVAQKKRTMEEVRTDALQRKAGQSGGKSGGGGQEEGAWPLETTTQTKALTNSPYNRDIVRAPAILLAHMQNRGAAQNIDPNLGADGEHCHPHPASAQGRLMPPDDAAATNAPGLSDRERISEELESSSDSGSENGEEGEEDMTDVLESDESEAQTCKDSDMTDVLDSDESEAQTCKDRGMTDVLDSDECGVQICKDITLNTDGEFTSFNENGEFAGQASASASFIPLVDSSIWPTFPMDVASGDVAGSVGKRVDKGSRYTRVRLEELEEFLRSHEVHSEIGETYSRETRQRNSLFDTSIPHVPTWDRDSDLPIQTSPFDFIDDPQYNVPSTSQKRRTEDNDSEYESRRKWSVFVLAQNLATAETRVI
ncbi:hypothetical protein R3P38DRAFT_3460266 [Favolaschia claudopus]|uniref:Uncharacterized protein n=1 Tax=Favolaschia claudopus TaxID=2862362 RepID=A0AAV9ZH92_9AGAR